MLMNVSSVAANVAAQAVAALANKPVAVVDAPHDGDSDDRAAAPAPLPPGVGKLVDKKA